jgi:DNA polymerase-1
VEQEGDDLSLMAYVAGSNQGTLSCAKNAAQVYLEISLPDSPTAIVSSFPALKEKLWEIICERKQEEVYYLEMKLSPILFHMEKQGFKVDKQGLLSFSQFLESKIAESESAIFEYADEQFNVNSSKQLGYILFEKLNLPHGKKTKTGYSTDAEVLEKLSPYHPIIGEILIFRQLSKLKSTYADGLLKAICDDGRIRTTFRQTLTQTGRLSSAEPNLQNIPVRTDLGKIFRKFFIADDGHVLIDADYSQIELRILAHISEDESLITAFKNGEDIHTMTASGVFGIPAPAVNPELRKRAKAINFGIIYGISDFALSNDIGVSVKEAKAYINGYFETYPKILEYLESTVKKAYEDGYVTTLFGRRRYIPELSAPNKITKAFGERIARNSPIQGTAADIIKKAMIDVSDEFKKRNLKSRIILQIHDELIVESPDCEKEEAAQILREGMEKAYSLSVPLIAEAVFGKTWFDAHG